MHPLLPSDARVLIEPEPTCQLDGVVVSLTTGEAERLMALVSRLNGRNVLEEVAESAQDLATIAGLHDAGIVFDLPVGDDGVPVAAFCDYLYTRAGGWRQGKRPDAWPWRDVIASGEATTGYLQGILIENYHYVRAAVVRQSPLLSRAVPAAVFDLVREFVIGEASHEGYFLSALTRWGVPARDITESVPLTATAQFIALQYRLAHLSLLDYLAGSAVLEVDPDVYARQGDPYQPWESTYELDPEILAPVREHIREDVAGGHAQLFRAVVSASGLTRLPTDTAVSAFQSARTVFEASRLWQREMYEHYYVQGAAAMMAGL